jgi:hypothetical protein
MKHKKNIIYIILGFIFITISGFVINEVKKDTLNIKTIESVKKSIAGNQIQFVFESNKTENIYVFIHHSNGKTLLKPDFVIDNKITYKIPENFSNKAGVLNWYLVHENKILIKDKINILPFDGNQNKLESYLAPSNAWVGDNNYVIFITLPLDKYDNSLIDGTKITFNENNYNKITNSTIEVKDFITWKKSFAPIKSGKIFINANYKNISTKEFEAEIFPGIALPFTINYERIHDYADGNQITTLKTSILKDKFGNIISNGTQVVFEFINSKNEYLKTFGTTIDGVATAKWIHPEAAENYKIKAKIPGFAKSNTISLRYKSWNFNINYELFNNNRKITIGPLRSYMNQLMPNGTKVTLKIFKNKNLLEERIEKTVNGVVNCNFEPHILKNGVYNFEISTLGKTIEINNVKLSN